MKPTPFVYLRPTALDEVVEMLQATQDTGKLLAGGQSLLPLLNMRLARPGHLIDMNFVPGLDQIENTDTFIRIGTMVRQRDLELSPIARQHLPMAVEALGHVAHVQIRHRGTVGGNLAHADPASELPTVMRALDATFVARGSSGERRIPANEFFVGLFTTALESDELLSQIEVPHPPDKSGWAFEEYARRRGDFALVAVAAGVTLDDGHIVDSRLTLAGMAGEPHRPPKAEQHLNGTPVSRLDAVLDDVAAAATDGLRPADDLEAPTAYRLGLARELTRRAVRRATQRASTTRG